MAAMDEGAISGVITNSLAAPERLHDVLHTAAPPYKLRSDGKDDDGKQPKFYIGGERSFWS